MTKMFLAKAQSSSRLQKSFAVLMVKLLFLKQGFSHHKDTKIQKNPHESLRVSVSLWLIFLVAARGRVVYFALLREKLT